MISAITVNSKSSEEVAHLTSLTRKMKLEFDFPSTGKNKVQIVQENDLSKLQNLFPSIPKEELQKIYSESNSILTQAINNIELKLKRERNRTNNLLSKRRTYNNLLEEDKKRSNLEFYHYEYKPKNSNPIKKENSQEHAVNEKEEINDYSSSNKNSAIINSDEFINDLYEKILCSKNEKDRFDTIFKTIYGLKDDIINLFQLDNVLSELKANKKSKDELAITSDVVNKKVYEERIVNYRRTNELNKLKKEEDYINKQIMVVEKESDFFRQELEKIKNEFI